MHEGSDGAPGTEASLSRHPERRPTEPLAVVCVVATAAAVVGLPLAGFLQSHDWWVAVPTLAALVATPTGHLAAARSGRTEQADGRSATGTRYGGLLGLTILAAETVLLLGALILLATAMRHATG